MDTGLSVLALAALAIGMRPGSAQDGTWSASAAWLRALLYLCFCLVLAHLAGVLPVLASLAPIKPGQLNDSAWLLATGCVTLFGLWAFGHYCHLVTLRFSRPSSIVYSAVFGLLWGLASALLLLSVWHLTLFLFAFWPWWVVAILAFALSLLWHVVWMRFYWEAWVLPEHQSAAGRRDILMIAHVPYLVFCLAHFAVFQNYWLLLLWQVLALVAFCVNVRIPSPRSAEPGPPPRREAGLLGFSRATGHLPE